MEKDKYLVLLSSFVPFGPMRLTLLIKYFKKPKNVWEANLKELSSIGLGEKLITAFDKYRRSFDFDNYFIRLKRLGIGFITKFDEDYPENLKLLEDAPFVLYIKGKLKKADEEAVAIVGARKMTSYGNEVAEIFSNELARMGVTLVSGLARGIDTVVHRCALDASGRTIAVLGCGLDMVYPLENTSLAKKIIEAGSAVISEFPLGYPALRPNFATRNRIISGLSKVVVVVEGQEKSGTLLTASHAANQGRTVFAVPGQITSPMSGASHFLIKNGAKIAFEVSDILEELNIQFGVDRNKVATTFPADKSEEKILETLSTDNLHLDEIARILGLPISEISARVIIMEMKGMVKSLGGGIYKKC